MPSLQENIHIWSQHHDWSERGDEWSAVWGGPRSQWFGWILPRIQAFLPAETILEIAPGFGRWTQFLMHQCTNLVAVDLAERCIEACEQRFAGHAGITYHANDGRSLAMVPDGTIDFACSFDSLVHADAEVVIGYLAQIARKLQRNGVAFIHHSNFGEYVDVATGQLPTGVENPHWRDLTVSSRMIREVCPRIDLSCVSQENINWGGGAHLIDTFTVVTRPGSIWDVGCVVVDNPEFEHEAAYVKRLSQVFGRERFGRSLPAPAPVEKDQPRKAAEVLGRKRRPMRAALSAKRPSFRRRA